MDRKLRRLLCTDRREVRTVRLSEERDMSTSTLVLIGIIVALCIPYLMRRRARLGREK
jgi:hypothetical protein